MLTFVCQIAEYFDPQWCTSNPENALFARDALDDLLTVTDLFLPLNTHGAGAGHSLRHSCHCRPGTWGVQLGGDHRDPADRR